jgi:alkylation response protein AidB-like acyl-CoA dehydrogenase
MSWSNVDDAVHGRMDPAKVSATKVAATEGFLDVLGRLMAIVGQLSWVDDGPPSSPGSAPDAALGTRLSHMYRHHLALTFGGGANEVQREIIATRGLGLPRSR